MPTVITVIAANALPMIIVNSIMPTPNTMMPIVTLPLGMMPPTSAVATADTMMIRIASSLSELYDHDDDSQQHEIIRFHMEILPVLYTHEVAAVCPRRVNRANLRL